MKACVFFVFLAGATIAKAGVPSDFKESKPVVPPGEIPLNLIDTRIDQTFQSDFKSGFREYKKGNNNTNTWHYRIQASHRFALNDNWYLRLGIDAQRFDFGDNRSIAPNTLQSYAGVVALEYFRDNNLGFFVQTRPGVYFSHEVTGSSFDAPTDAAFAYPVVDGHVWLVGGISFAYLREYRFLPLVGVRWLINDKWDLNAVLPAPKLTYKATEHLSLNVGGELYGGSFRSDSSDVSDIDRARVDYYEVRGGAGVSYDGLKPVTVSLGAGYAFVRKFHYEGSGLSAETDPAPYLSLQASARF